MSEKTVRKRRNIREEARKNYRNSDSPANQYYRKGPQYWIKAICAGFLLSSAFTPVILVLIPSPIEPREYSYPLRPKFTGALEANDILQKADHIYEDQLYGPESIVFDGDHIYTGTADGLILDIHKGEVTVLAQLGEEPCGTFELEPTCGRPLGMRLHSDGYLYVVDSYLGLFKINVATRDVHHLWPSSIPIGGSPIKFLNDLVVTSDGMIYMTDSSTRWDRRHNRYLVLEAERTGRLLEYNPKTNETYRVASHMAFPNGVQLSKKEDYLLICETTKAKILNISKIGSYFIITINRLLEYNPKTNETYRVASHMAFPNGVQLSKKEDYLLICETTKAKILKFYLKGSRTGEIETFMDNLPGLPDNIRRSSSGGFWIGFATVRRREKFSLVDYTASRPWIRRLVAKLFPQEFLMKFLPKYGLIIEVSEECKIIRSLHDPTGEHIPSVSEVEDRNGVLYLGSYNLPYISRLHLRNNK